MIFIVIIVLSFLLQLILPWWIILIIAFAVCGFVGRTSSKAFWHSFLAIAILWLGYSLFKSLPNDNLLAGRVAVMIGVQKWWAILAVTSIIGGLAAGISGFCGYHFRNALLVKKKHYY